MSRNMDSMICDNCRYCHNDVNIEDDDYVRVNVMCLKKNTHTRRDLPACTYWKYRSFWCEIKDWCSNFKK